VRRKQRCSKSSLCAGVGEYHDADTVLRQLMARLSSTHLARLSGILSDKVVDDMHARLCTSLSGWMVPSAGEMTVDLRITRLAGRNAIGESDSDVQSIVPPVAFTFDFPSFELFVGSSSQYPNIEMAVPRWVTCRGWVT
jgi:hypothetical protein